MIFDFLNYVLPGMGDVTPGPFIYVLGGAFLLVFTVFILSFFVGFLEALTSKFFKN